MKNLIQWLLAAVGPLVARAMIALGFTAVTFTGVTAAVNSLVTYAQSYWSVLPYDVLQLAHLTGVPECLGMIMAAYVARVALWASLNGVKYVLHP